MGLVRKIKFDKKGTEHIFWKITNLVIAIVVMVIVIRIFFPGAIGIGEDLSSQFEKVEGDSDNDGIQDFMDDCPCSYGDFEFGGCPSNLGEEEKEEERRKYHYDTKCGVLETETEEIVVEEGGFEHYRTVELFGDAGKTDFEAEIRQACVGLVGSEGDNGCESEANSCNEDNFDYNYLIGDGCFLMISEDDDINPNDCGQAEAKEGSIISADNFGEIGLSVGSIYYSVSGENDPKDLTFWKWKSTEEYGSLICSSSYWFSCKEGQEGRSLTLEIESREEKYLCTNGEWEKQDEN